MAARTQKSIAERNQARDPEPFSISTNFSFTIVSAQFFEYSLRLRKLFQNAVLFCNRIPIRIM